MRRLLSVLASVVLGVSTAFAQPDPGGSLVRRPVGTREFHVCASECDATQVCGATCTSATSDCVAGSMIARIKSAGLYSETRPYTIVVEPGTYTECIAFNDVTDINLHLKTGVRIVPVVASAADVEGGVIRIGNNTTSKVERIRITGDGYVRNDAWSAPEAALNVGVQACTGTTKWDDLTVDGGIWIGNHDGIHVCGDKTNSNTQTGIPKVMLSNLRVISGADTIIKKAASDMTIRNVRLQSISNYCESTNTDVTNSATGTVIARGASTTSFTLSDDAAFVLDAYVGRHGTLTGGSCNGGTNVNFWITDYDANRLVTTSALGFTPDENCTYTIDAVANVSESPCTEVDWTTIRSNGVGSGYWKNTAFHFGLLIASQSTAPDLDITKVYDSTFEVEVNDFGPNSGSSACQAQQQIAGILGYNTGHWQKAAFENVHIRVTNNTVMRSSTDEADNLCAYPLGGVIISPSGPTFEDDFSFSGDILVTNTADIGATDYGVVLATANTMRLMGARIVVNNTIANYAGTTATASQTAGTILSSLQACSIITDLAAADDNFEFWSAPQATTILSVGCRCRGTCSPTLATFSLEDRGGNAMSITDGTPACATTGAIAFKTVTAGGGLVAGEGLAFDVSNSPNPATDTYTICATYAP